MSVAQAMELVQKRKERLLAVQLEGGAARFFYRSVVVEFQGRQASARER